jgi:bifunctional DNase/RNase
VTADLVRVEPVALLPTQAGCAVFLGDGQKAIVFYIEPSIGASINSALSDTQPPRPLTHDLFNDVLKAFGATVERVLIVKVENDVFYARIFFQAENEVRERMIVELDARPSDSIALAVRQEAPIFVVKEVWDKLKDMTSVLEELRDKGMDFETGD